MDTNKINIYLEFKGKVIVLPINPEELTINRPGNNENTNVIGIGEINIIKDRKLIPITIESFFPGDKNPDEYVEFLKTVQELKQPLRLICKDFKINLLMSIDGFEINIKSGEEKDRYYVLELQEWRDYSPIILSKSEPKKEQSQSPQEQAQPPQEQQPQKKEKKQKGDVVKFLGGSHYHTSQDSKPTGKPRTVGLATITLTAEGSKHPYHLIGNPGGSNVYGWVDEGSFE